MNTDKELMHMVQSIADDLTNGIELDPDEHQHIIEENGQEPGDFMYASDYLANALDIEYIISGRGEYLGARILVTFGGPNIWINTRSGVVEGYWWTDKFFASFSDGMGLDDFLQEIAPEVITR